MTAATRFAAVQRAGHRCMVLGATATMLSGCFTSTVDFKRDAESFIGDEVASEVGAVFTSVVCVAPVDQDVGTRFACSAIDDTGGVWEFDNLIDAPGEFTVTIQRRP